MSGHKCLRCSFLFSWRLSFPCFLFVFLGSLAACASFNGVHFAEVLEDKQVCLLDRVKNKSANEESHGGFRRPLLWPANAASVAPITAWRLNCQGTGACAALSSSLGASLFLASFFVFLGSLAACASFKGVHFAEVLEDKQMCLLDAVSLLAVFLVCRLSRMTTRQFVTFLAHNSLQSPLSGGVISVICHASSSEPSFDSPPLRKADKLKPPPMMSTWFSSAISLS